MRISGRSWPRVAAQLRSLIDRSVVGLLIGLSVLMLLLGKADMKLANYMGERMGDAVAPVLRVLGQPPQAIRRHARVAAQTAA